MLSVILLLMVWYWRHLWVDRTLTATSIKGSDVSPPYEVVPHPEIIKVATIHFNLNYDLKFTCDVSSLPIKIAISITNR